MDELELLNEFSSILESIEMPDHLKTALMEAFTYSNNGFVIPNGTPLPQNIQDEVERRLKLLETRTRSMGMDFNREKARHDLENQARRFPQKFSMSTEQIAAKKRNELLMDKMVGMSMRNSALGVLDPSEARQNYYKAAVDMLRRTYQKYSIPFDAQKALDYVMQYDASGNHRDFERSTARNIYFPTFSDANTNQILNLLKRENPALNKILQKCYWFTDGLKKAQAEGSAEGYLAMQRMKYTASDIPDVRHPSAQLTAEDQAEFDRKEAIRLAKENTPKGTQSVASNASCVGDLRNVFSRLPYVKLYDRFAKAASPEQLAATPRPDEKFFQYLWRVDRGSTPVGVFVDRMAKDMKVAYPEMDWNRTLEYYMDKVNEFRDFSMLSKPDVEHAVGQGLVSQENAPLYTIWDTFHHIKQAKQRLNR